MYGGMYNNSASSDSYADRQLRLMDAENYASAGIQLYRRVNEGIELLCPRERPWNSFTQAYDPCALNVFGGKRVPRQERMAETTGVRCLLECVGHVDGAPDTESLYAILHNSFVVWYAMGKFALLVAEVPKDSLVDLPEQFSITKQQSGPQEEFKMLPSGVRKYIKQIEELDWVPAAELVPQSQVEVTDLLGNLLQIPAFRDFLEGTLDPDRAFPEAENRPMPAPPCGGKSKGKGKKSGGKGKDKGGGWKGGGYGKGGAAFGMGGNMGGVFSCKGMAPMGANKGMGYCGKGMSMFPGGDGMAAAAPMGYAAYDQNSEEKQRQMYGEQLYLLVQPMAPSPYLAQKITGMLLELPQNELLLNLTNQEELYRRVQEALEVLKEDGDVN